jgi:pimeloyl-ACP methyl ester carboxylesterase
MIDERIARFATRTSRGISYRETGSGQTLVLLHGIGSQSASWLNQLETLQGYRLIAWDAPGYGGSDLLTIEKPFPHHYAEALHLFIDRLLLKDIVIVGNSLGCLMAGAYAAAHPERVRSMILLDPAAGHAGDESKQRERLKQFEELGPEGLAEKRSPTLVGKNSPREAVELMAWTQRRIRPPGYRQAVHCLTYGNLAEDARRFQKKVLVACGSEDTVTPEASCKAVAAAFPRAEYRSLPGLGHVPHMEAPDTVNALIRGFVA